MSDIRIATPEDQILLEKEAKYCSYGDTVHYIEPPRIFSRCEGSYVWDTEDQAYLDLRRGVASFFAKERAACVDLAAVAQGTGADGRPAGFLHRFKGGFFRVGVPRYARNHPL